jgi:dihydrofolate synthase/folylpolyglutamate synthase
LDGAHNIGGARALAEYLDQFEKGPITMVYGTMRDKDVGQIAQILFPKATNLILTNPDNSRALPADDLLMFTSKENVHVTRSAKEAIRLADDISDGLILVTGSLYLVGDVMKLLKARDIVS